MTKQDPFAGKTVESAEMGASIIGQRYDNAPKVGDLAPDLELAGIAGERRFPLRGSHGLSPVVLVFGSYT